MKLSEGKKKKRVQHADSEKLAWAQAINYVHE